MTGVSKPLTGEFFQLGYVTKDIDGAIDLYRERYGIGNFMRFSSTTETPEGQRTMEIALGWHGPVMIEFIQPDPKIPGIYKDAIREDGGIQIHHLGYLADADNFATLAERFRAAGFAVPVEMHSPVGVSLIYADNRADNGLFSEFILVNEASKAFFDAVPHN